MMVLSTPEPQPHDQQPNSDESKRYHAPGVIVLGTLDDLTHFTSSGFVPDGDPTNNGFS